MGKNHKDEGMKSHVSGQSNKPLSRPAHALTARQVIQEIKADPEMGLSTDDAKARLEEYGKNEFGENKGVQPVKIFIGQIANAMTLVMATTIPDRPKTSI